MSARKVLRVPSRKRVLIVDDHPITRHGLVQLINHQKDLQVCGEAASASEALKLAELHKPALAIVDISLPGKSGLELVKDLRPLNPELRILILSMYDEMLYAERVLRAGAHGYIMKQEGGERVMTAVRQVLDGQVYLSQKMTRQIMDNLAGTRRRPAAPTVQSLTDRELEVLTLIGRGLSRWRVAEQLHVSVRTVEAHRTHLRTKLNLRDATALIHYAVNWLALQEHD